MSANLMIYTCVNKMKSSVSCPQVLKCGGGKGGICYEMDNFNPSEI